MNHRSTDRRAAVCMLPTRLAVAVLAVASLTGCPEDERCLHTFTADGAATPTACADDAGCYHYEDPPGTALFTDCRDPDACSSVRTYPDGARGPGGNYC